MYTQYWQLQCPPFDNTVNPRFFFRSRSHQAALLKMRYTVEHSHGAALVVGGVGSGKSYLIEQLPHELPDSYGPVVNVIYPQLSSAELLAYVADELAGNETGNGSVKSLDQTIHTIQKRLTTCTQDGRHPILMIDEAHFIEDPRVFQALSLLLNFQQRPEIDFSLILVGEPSLLAEVRRVAQLDDRLATKSVLEALSHEETAQYVQHRLRVAGRREPIFDQSAFGSLFELSGGIPRKINRLCDLALLVGYADQLNILTATEIEAVSEELAAVTN